MSRVILVSGSRGFPHPELVTAKIKEVVQPGDRVLHGGTRGVDTIAAITAHSVGASVCCYPANWSVYGRQAGMVRNEVMLNEAQRHPEYLVCIFWDGDSRGTKHMIDLCRERQISFELIRSDA
jgi:hypothetical protein